MMENTTIGNEHLQEHSQLISDDLAAFFFFINYASLGQAINIFGMATNAVSLVVFAKLGFKDTVNISLVALTVSDFCSLITLFFFNLCMTPSFNSLTLPFEPYDVAFLTVGWSHVGFARVTCYLTAFIALERCLCIAAPLKIKSILTSRRTTLIVTVIFPLMYMSVTPIYLTASLQWGYSSFRNRTLILMTYNDQREYMESILPVVNNVVPLVAFVIIVSCTAITFLQLKQKAKWRQQSAHAGNKASVVDKDNKVGLMVLLISTIFIICYLPAEIVFVWIILDPEMRFDGARSNTFKVSVSLLYLFETINASVNIFVYLAMSSKYKVMFITLFCGKKRKHGVASFLSPL